ncbi:MAG: hypothetical protein IJY73_07520 [Oscillospiraceae bacterium]|nr:hypothetical protein [Oscillospiraceae bacterium]
MRGCSETAAELINRLRFRALGFIADPRILWELTAEEIWELIQAHSAREKKCLEDSYRRNELLAFNIGALCRTAVNAPEQFPKSPAEAFS